MKVGAVYVQRVSGLAEIARQRHSAIRRRLLAGCPPWSGQVERHLFHNTGGLASNFAKRFHVDGAHLYIAGYCQMLGGCLLPPTGSAACELTGPTGRVSGIFKSSTGNEDELLGGWVLLLLCNYPLDEATAGMSLSFRFHLAERCRAS